MGQMPSTNAGTERASPLVKPITLSDLTDELLWPKLFRAVPLALRPERLGIAFFTLVIASLLAKTFMPAEEPPRVDEFLKGLADATGLTGSREGFHPRSWFVAEFEWLFGVRWPTVEEHPWMFAAAAVPGIVVLVIGFGAVARMAACEFSQGVMLTWTRGLGFALSRWLTLTGAVIGPIVVLGFFVLLVSGFGWVLFNWSASGVLGAVLYPIALLLGLLAVLLLVGYWLGHLMLAPAVACEGTDAIDAAQRTYAYVVGRPLRLLVYQFIVYGLLIVSASVLMWVVAKTELRTAEYAARWAGASARAALDPNVSKDGLTGAWKVAGEIIEFWTLILRLLVSAFVFSYGASASTILYLLIRKLNDGQDVSEIWMPGMVGGTLAPVVEAGNGDDDEE